MRLFNNKNVKVDSSLISLTYLKLTHYQKKVTSLDEKRVRRKTVDSAR